MLVTLLGCAVIALANGLLTNALYGAPKGVYLFVGKTYAADGVSGQTLRAVRGRSAANVTQTGYASMEPCNNEGTHLCVIVDLTIEGVSLAAFDFDQKSLAIEIDGRTFGAGDEISRAGLPDSMIDGPVRLKKGQSVQTSARVALPRAADGVKRPATILIRGLDSGVSWRYDLPTW
ncbi:hypothetical protein AXK57_01605 [Tsukamurella pulmonis]|uniref:hypothetical protein n=1 Tax=Tsukamurella pulmonis TaxID=47312 RepID=UPI0007971938|nr:hypothetical protein [Tsukamurella pulmonis]KXP12965.1 hypothetical protein AXK57_01605 [Tsukamurella pulmonis]RDH09870.1 hypothetical protein DVB88_20105 [Tsukamurella pulmonis]